MRFFNTKPKFNHRKLLEKMSAVLSSVQTKDQFLFAMGFIGYANRKLNRDMDAGKIASELNTDPNDDDISVFGVAGASMAIKRRCDTMSKHFLGHEYSPQPLIIVEE